MHTYREDAGFSGDEWPQAETADVTKWHYQESTGLLTAKEDAAGKIVSYAYTTGGRLTSRTWARSNGGQPLVTNYGYSPATGELTSIDYSDSTPDVAFTYDRLGRQDTVTDAVGARNFAYNDKLQLESETVSGLVDRVITRSYIPSGVPGRPTGFTLGADYEVQYGYDNTGRLNAVGWNVNGVEDTAAYSYLPGSDLIASLSTGNGQNTTYTYEPNRNLKTQVSNGWNGSLISEYSYQYDALGRRINVANTGTAFAQPAHTQWGYDNRNQLIESARYLGADLNDTSSPVPAEYREYTYDPIGNRQNAIDQDGETPITYATNQLNEYTAVGLQSPTYDSDGNLTSDGGKKYSYNAENQLVSVAPESPQEGDTRVGFIYDYMGRRVAKTVQQYSGGTWVDDQVKVFVYDGWNLIEESKILTDSVETKYYVWGLDLSQSLQGAGGIGGLLASVDDAGVYYFLYDANGNVGQMVDSAGNLVAKYEYDAYGNVIVASGTLAGENCYRFSTKYADEETGLDYYGYRYYDSENGRWTQRDPSALRSDDADLYTFVRNTPLNAFDARGLFTQFYNCSKDQQRILVELEQNGRSMARASLTVLENDFRWEGLLNKYPDFAIQASEVHVEWLYYHEKIVDNIKKSLAFMDANIWTARCACEDEGKEIYHVDAELFPTNISWIRKALGQTRDYVTVMPRCFRIYEGEQSPPSQTQTAMSGREILASGLVHEASHIAAFTNDVEIDKLKGQPLREWAKSAYELQSDVGKPSERFDQLLRGFWNIRGTVLPLPEIH
jgi:RHS repeat-associated protein